MEQLDEPNHKRPKLLEVQVSNVHVREELQSDADLSIVDSIQVCRRDSELTSVKLQNVKSNENETNSALKVHEIEEQIEPPVSVIVNSLETINDDCLREICLYLDIMDIVNLATISGRMLQFSEDFIFPKAAKKTCILSSHELNRLTLLHNRRSIELTLESLETAFRYFGEFVEDLKLNLVLTANILANCHNLKKLSLIYNEFKPNETLVLQNQIEGLQNLNELKFLCTTGITTNWRTSNGISNVKTLFLEISTGVNGPFIDYFKNLTSLSVNLTDDFHIDNLVKMIDNSSHSLMHLKVRNFPDRSALETSLETFARVITDELHKLENLELEFTLTEATACLIQLPHVKSLNIIFNDDRNINSVLQTLCENGIIEELTIRKGGFDEGEANAQPPLNLNKLRTITWLLHERFSGILKTFTKSQMPEIQTIQFHFFESHYLDDLIKFIESKNTLISIKLLFIDDIKLIPLSFWHQIIGILKEFAQQKRPFLSFVIWPFKLEEKVVELLKVNRNLMDVQGW